MKMVNQLPTNNKEGDTVDLTSATTNLTKSTRQYNKDGRKEKYKKD